MHCEIWRENNLINNLNNNNLLVTGQTEHILVNSSGKPFRPEGQVKEIFDKIILFCDKL